MKTTLPKSKLDLTIETNVDLSQPLVIVGANGSGKTRLGVRLEEKATDPVCHRISAHRALNFPETVQPMEVTSALKSLYFGSNAKGVDISSRIYNRWKRKPETALLNDFEALVVALFSEENQIAVNYRQDAKQTTKRLHVPTTSLDHVKEIWASIHPQRELISGSGKVEVKTTKNTSYSASELSDGERVTFYLVAQVVLAPKGAIILIDEPELHLHRAIQEPLWNAIEAARPDCGFIYITHDLGFAATRIGATKIWLSEFDGTDWAWERIEEAEGIREELLLEVLGSRRPTLFVEGDKTSWDYLIYSVAYPNHHILPISSCGQVIFSVKALAGVPSLHHNNVCGIIDRDYRTPTSLSKLEASSIFHSDFAEIENLLAHPKVIRAMAKICGCPDPDQVVLDCEELVLSEFEKHKSQYVAERVKAEIRDTLGTAYFEGNNAEDIEADFNTKTAFVNIPALFKTAEEEANKLLSDSDVSGILKAFNHKGLFGQIDKHLGLVSKGYQSRLKSHASELKPIFEELLPELS